MITNQLTNSNKIQNLLIFKMAVWTMGLIEFKGTKLLGYRKLLGRIFVRGSGLSAISSKWPRSSLQIDFMAPKAALGAIV